MVLRLKTYSLGFSVNLKNVLLGERKPFLAVFVIRDYFLQSEVKLCSCPEALRELSGHYEQMGPLGQSKKRHSGMAP